MTRLEAVDYFHNKTWSQICLTYERLPPATSEVKFISSLAPCTFSIIVYYCLSSFYRASKDIVYYSFYLFAHT